MQVQAYRMLGGLSFVCRVDGWNLCTAVVLVVQMYSVPIDLNGVLSICSWNASSWPVLSPERSKAVITAE